MAGDAGQRRVPVEPCLRRASPQSDNVRAAVLVAEADGQLQPRSANPGRHRVQGAQDRAIQSVVDVVRQARPDRDDAIAGGVVSIEGRLVRRDVQHL